MVALLATIAAVAYVPAAGAHQPHAERPGEASPPLEASPQKSSPREASSPVAPGDGGAPPDAPPEDADRSLGRQVDLSDDDAADGGDVGEDRGELAGGGVQTLGDSCERSSLPPHRGLQEGSRCVATEMGEVPAAEQAPQVLITAAPGEVAVGEPFTLRVSSRNLVRDRFLGAAEGGYYRESSFLSAGGLVRGHVHVACRTLPDGLAVAPDPAEAEFFQGIEDGGGGARPDEVAVAVSGLSRPGLAQCAAWAGDGSHRVPLMATARQIPAFDSVLIRVR